MMPLPRIFISMTEQLSGVVQVPRRCPDRCQEWYRNLPESLTSHFQGWVIWRLAAYTHALHGCAPWMRSMEVDILALISCFRFLDLNDKVKLTIKEKKVLPELTIEPLTPSQLLHLMGLQQRHNFWLKRKNLGIHALTYDPQWSW